MSVYVDEMTGCLKSESWPYPKSCHMIADTEDELRAFAVEMGLKAQWFQPKSFPHFDLTENKRDIAIRRGAIALGLRDFVKKMNALRKAPK